MRQALIVENPKWERYSDVSEEFKALSGNAILVVRGRVKEINPTGTLTQVYKKLPETPEEYAAELRKLRKTPEEIAQLVKAFKPPTKEQIAAASSQVIKPTDGKTKVFKSKPETREALAADLGKQGEKPEEIEKAVAASKLPSIHDKVKKAAALVLALCLFSFSAAAQGLNLLGYLPSTTIVGSSTNSTSGQGKIGWNLGAEAVFQLSLNSTNYAGSAVTVDLAISDNGSDWITNQIAIACTPLGQFATNTATAISRQTNSAGAKWLQVNQIRNLNTNTITIQRFDVSVYNPQ